MRNYAACYALLCMWSLERRSFETRVACTIGVATKCAEVKHISPGIKYRDCSLQLH